MSEHAKTQKEKETLSAILTALEEVEPERAALILESAGRFVRLAAYRKRAAPPLDPVRFAGIR